MSRPAAPETVDAAIRSALSRNTMPRQAPLPLPCLALAASLATATAVHAATQTVDVASTEPGLPTTSPHYASPQVNGPNYVHYDASSRPVLVVFLGGTGSKPTDYTWIVDEAAAASTGYATGYGAISLAYLDGSSTDSMGAECGRVDACYTQARGENAYGKGVKYPGAAASYDATKWERGGAHAPTTQGDSIVNRLVLLLDWLAWHATDARNPAPAYWRQFLRDDPSASGTYVSPHDAQGRLNWTRSVLPDWSRIVIAGHSQGGGEAAFLAMTVPGGVRRAALFSAPQDYVGGSGANAVASWVKGTTTTPLTRFYGLRNASGGTTPPNDEAEGAYGDNVGNGWAHLGAATGPGGLGGPQAGTPTNVGAGGVPPGNGSHDLYLTSPAYGDALSNHNSSAANVYAKRPAVLATWDWMLGAGGTDPGTP